MKRFPKRAFALALLACALSTPSSGQVGGIVITPENVDLAGAGTLEFEPDRSAFTGEELAATQLRGSEIRLWIGPDGKPIACEPDKYSAAPTFDLKICGQAMQSARFAIAPGFDLPFTKGMLKLHAGATPNPAGDDGQYEVTTAQRPTYIATIIHYPAFSFPDDLRLTQEDGTLDVPIDLDDYPPIARRMGVQGRSLVLLGSDDSGRVTTCRPVESSGTALLDNTACSLALSRGRFTFAPGKTPFDGLRYHTFAVRWQVGN